MWMAVIGDDEADGPQSSVSKSLALLTVLGELSVESEGSVRLVDLVNRTNSPRPTIHRLLGQLRKHGFVEQLGEKGRYRLGNKLLLLSAQCLGGLDIRRISGAYLRDFANRIDQTVHLGIRDGIYMVFIDKFESASPRGGQFRITLSSSIGRRQNSTTTALGKILLAFSTSYREEIKELALPKLTSHSLTTKDALLKDIELSRGRGYSIDNEEGEVGIRCVAAPIFDHVGAAIAGVSVTTLSSQVPMTRLHKFGEELCLICSDISKALGNARK
jgi:DNA-binding IclR family transcriptional regulator